MGHGFKIKKKENYCLLKSIVYVLEGFKKEKVLFKYVK